MPTLVVGPNWVGDMIMAHSLIAQIKAADPDDPIDMLAPAWSLAIAKRMPEIRDTECLPFARGRLELAGRWKMARRLARRGYHTAYVLPNSLKSALIPAMAGVTRRVGWRGEHRYGLLTDLRALKAEQFPMMVDRYRVLGFDRSITSADQLPSPRPNPVLEVDLSNQQLLMSRFQLNPSRVVALCPGAEFGPAKQWPLAQFAALGAKLVEAGWQVMLLGSDKDRPACDWIVNQQPIGEARSWVNLAGQTALTDAIDLLACARVCVSNDSGLMHVAAATGRPLVALFGPSSALHTPPLSDHATVLTHPVDCHPCFQRVCPLRHQACLSELAVESVWAALRPWLQTEG